MYIIYMYIKREWIDKDVSRKYFLRGSFSSL